MRASCRPSNKIVLAKFFFLCFYHAMVDLYYIWILLHRPLGSTSLGQVLTLFTLFLSGFLTSVLAMVASALASPSPCGRCPSTSLTDERMLSLMKLWPDVLWSRPAAAWTPSSSLTTSSTTISGGITRLAKLPSRWPLMLHGNNLYFFVSDIFSLMI